MRIQCLNEQSLSKSLQELKELAYKQFNMQLELIKELPSLKFTEAVEFKNWYANHPLQKEILERDKKSSTLKEDLYRQ